MALNRILKNEEETPTQKEHLSEGTVGIMTWS